MIEFYDYVTENVVSVWIGKFESETELFEFVDFIYDSDGDSFNLFCKEAGLSWFDHDFQEANYLSPKDDLAAAMRGHSWLDSFKDELFAALSKIPPDAFNSIFLLYDFRYEPQAAQPETDSRLKFLGSFKFQKDE